MLVELERKAIGRPEDAVAVNGKGELPATTGEGARKVISLTPFAMVSVAEAPPS